MSAAKDVSPDQTFKVIEDTSSTGKHTLKIEEPTAEEQVGHTTVSGKASSPLDTISDYIKKTKSTSTTDDDTLVDVKVHNPFARIVNLLKEIKAHQSTTVSLRFTIPLIALPIVLLAAFQLGRAQTVCASRFTSQVGTLKMLTVMAPTDPKDSFEILRSFFPDIPKLQRKTELRESQKVILMDAQGGILNVLHPLDINLSKFNNMAVIITGQHSPCTGIITLDAIQNIIQL